MSPSPWWTPTATKPPPRHNLSTLNHQLSPRHHGLLAKPRNSTLLMAGSVGSDDGDIGFQIAPMVDVVFVLMLFFMACAGSQVKEKELKIALPSGAPQNSSNNTK